MAASPTASTIRRHAGLALLGIALAFVATACDTATPTPTPGPTAYIGGKWTVAEVGAYRPEGPDAPRFQFRQDGSLQATTGCNNVYADVQIDGEPIVLDQLAVTTAGCPNDLLRDTGPPSSLRSKEPRRSAARRSRAGSSSLVWAATSS